MKSTIHLLRAVLCDTKRLLPEVKGLDRDLKTIEERLKHEGTSFVTCALPSYGKWFDRSLSVGRALSLPGFSRRGSLPRLFSGLIKSVFDAKTGLLLEEPSIEHIRVVREICYFFKKFSVASGRESILRSRAIEAFIRDESSILETFPEWYSFNRVCKVILPNLDSWDFLPGKHGPGSVLEGFSPNQKWIELEKRLVDMDVRTLDFGYDIVGSYSPAYTQSSVPSSHLELRPAKLVTVPKSSTALRTITVESCIAQFSQQSLNCHLRDEIRKCSILSQCLSLNDQSPNQQLAIDGSRTGTWCTIDLSSASDLLSVLHVQKVFQNRPRFLRGLMITRTPSVKVPGYTGELKLKKYAGMGNATTFPVQSVVFAVLAIATICEGTSCTFKDICNASKFVRVFGDDIIIHKDYFQAFSTRITSLGLKINQEKTFSEGHFRESCGVDAYKGYDVTPIYLRHDPDTTSADTSSFESVVSTSNQLWMMCRYTAAETLITRLRYQRHVPLPLVRFESSGIGLHTRQNCSTIQRWNGSLHRFEVKTMQSIPLRRKDQLDGYAALLKFFHCPRLSEYNVEHLRTSVRRFTNRLRLRWEPSY